MKIKPFVFLALASPAGAIAGSACHLYAGEEYPNGPGMPRQAAPPSASAAPPAQGAVSPRMTTIHLQSAPAPSATATAAAPSLGAACADNGAAGVLDCSALPAVDSSCSPVSPQQKCFAYRAYFNPKIAAIAVSCLAALPSRQWCDPSRAYDCGRSALAQACPDSSVAQLCNIAATACKSSASDCTTMLSGLNDQGKQQVAHCVAQGCPAGLSSCVDGLTPASPSANALTR